MIGKRLWGYPGARYPATNKEWRERQGLQRASPPGVSVSEDREKIYVEADVPGVAPEDIKLKFNQGVLRIRGRAKEQEHPERKYHSQAPHIYNYQVPLPNDVNPDIEPEANLQNGIIKIVFTRAPKQSSKDENSTRR